MHEMNENSDYMVVLIALSLLYMIFFFFFQFSRFQDFYFRSARIFVAMLATKITYGVEP